MQYDNLELRKAHWVEMSGHSPRPQILTAISCNINLIIGPHRSSLCFCSAFRRSPRTNGAPYGLLGGIPGCLLFTLMYLQGSGTLDKSRLAERMGHLECAFPTRSMILERPNSRQDSLRVPPTCNALPVDGKKF